MKTLKELKAAAKAAHEHYVAVKATPNITATAVAMADHQWSRACDAYFVAWDDAPAAADATDAAQKLRKLKTAVDKAWVQAVFADYDAASFKAYNAANASYKAAEADLYAGPEFGDGPEFEGWEERSSGK